MNLFMGCFFLFVLICIMAAIFVGSAMFVLGTIVLLSKLILWMAYLGLCFMVLGFIGWGLAKLFGR